VQKSSGARVFARRYAYGTPSTAEGQGTMRQHAALRRQTIRSPPLMATLAPVI
jgi:hypothetical protein